MDQKLETQNENIFSEHDKHFNHIQHVRNLFKWPGYPGKCTPKYTTSEDRDQWFIAHARINELRGLKDLFSQTSLSILSLKLPKLGTYDYRRKGHIYMCGVPICIGQHKAS